MTTIVTRAGKGSALSFTEMDANLTNLNNDKLESGGALGTPASGTLTNCTGLPVATGVSGLGSGVATALAANAGASGGFQLYDADIPTTAASQAEMEAGTEAAVRSISPLRVAQAIAALGGAGTLVRTTFTASGNLTFPAGVTQAWVTGQGSGGGGGGLTGAGSNGGSVTFGKNGEAVSLTLAGGTGGGTISSGTGGAGGAGGGSGINQGAAGKNGQYSTSVGGGVNPSAYAIRRGGFGGSGMFGNLGGGGDGADSSSSGGGVTADGAGGGGGAGEQCFSYPITVTSGQWDVTINSGGGAGTGTGGGTVASAGKDGFFIVEYFS